MIYSITCVYLETQKYCPSYDKYGGYWDTFEKDFPFIKIISNILFYFMTFNWPIVKLIAVIIHKFFVKKAEVEVEMQVRTNTSMQLEKPKRELNSRESCHNWCTEELWTAVRHLDRVISSGSIPMSADKNWTRNLIFFENEILA